MATGTAAEPIHECYRCGYDLRGIEDAQPCPECGLLAERSRRPTDHLHDAHPRWLRRISRGVWLIALTIPLAVAWPFLDTFLAERVFSILGINADWSESWRWKGYPFLGWDVVAVLFIVGTSLLTAREGYGPADRADAKRRRLLRIAATMPLLGLLIFQGEEWWYWTFASSYREDWRWGQILAMVLAIFGCVPLPLLLFRHLRGLAKRARRAPLAEHCDVVGIGASVAMVCIALVMLLFKEAEELGLGPWWGTTSNVSLVLTVLISLASSLFVLWSLFLLIRFATAFSRAHRQLKRNWARADRAESRA